MAHYLEKFKTSPIKLKFDKPTDLFLSELKIEWAAEQLVSGKGITIDSRYFSLKIEGARPEIYLRKLLVKQLSLAADLIGPQFGFVIFDGYRNKKTQKSLFNSFFEKIEKANPSWTTEMVRTETEKFVAPPSEISRFEIPPHNSGGAVDLGLTFEGVPLDMGTDFDDLSSIATTDFFESPCEGNSAISEAQWTQIRNNRRILFHSLKSVGFINWKYEWWHYDLGDSVWGKEHALPPIYDSMDSLVNLFKDG
jgi:D-alanyl-D-alanine dipeptidase